MTTMVTRIIVKISVDPMMIARTFQLKKEAATGDLVRRTAQLVGDLGRCDFPGLGAIDGADLEQTDLHRYLRRLCSCDRRRHSVSRRQAVEVDRVLPGSAGT